MIILPLFLTTMATAGQGNVARSLGKITARVGVSYLPVATIKFIQPNTKDNFYDNLTMRVSAEYFIAEYFSIGPGFEYLGKQVTLENDPSNPYDIAFYCFYADSRYSFPLTDSAANYLVFGMGTGIGNLDESGDAQGAGFCLYGLFGLDIALAPKFGLDLLYRYQTSRITIDGKRSYRFEGSTLQAGLSYRFEL